MKKVELKQLVADARACRLCEAVLPKGPRPVFQAQRSARILVAGQAPGRKVHETGIPFNDPSGDRLRGWMGIDRDTFYDPERIAILPMGFCYPGTGRSGDLPPRPECAQTWRQAFLEALPDIRLALIIGRYAQLWHLGEGNRKTLTETVRAWQEFQPTRIPLPHPSPRNNRWLRNNPWFETELVPHLQQQVRTVLQQ